MIVTEAPARASTVAFPTELVDIVAVPPVPLDVVTVAPAGVVRVTPGAAPATIRTEPGNCSPATVPFDVAVNVMRPALEVTSFTRAAVVPVNVMRPALAANVRLRAAVVPVKTMVPVLAPNVRL